MSTSVLDWTEGADTISYQVCNRCGNRWYFRRGFCPRCGEVDTTVLLSAGEGVIYSCSVVFRAPSEALRPLAPYAVLLVDMEEGFRMMGHGDASVGIGDPVRASFRDFSGTRLPYFSRAS